MQKFLLLLFPFLFFSGDNLKIKFVLSYRAEQILLDSVKNIYIVSRNKFLKFDNKGKEIAFFDSQVNEKISFADVSNPMKILLYYEGENKIIFSDNYLSKIGDEIQLEELGFSGNLFISVSEAGYYWIIDRSDLSVHKFNSDFKLLFSSILFEPKNEIDFFTVSANKLFLKTTDGSVYVYDDFGNFLYKLKKTIKSDFNITGNIISYYDASLNSVISYDFYSGNEKTIPLPDSVNAVNTFVFQNTFIANDSSKVYVFEIINEKTDKQ